MDREIQFVDNHPSSLPAAIPLVDFEHNILPLQFVIDPGEEVFRKDLHFTDEMVKRLTLSQSDKLKLLHQYFDITYIKSTKIEAKRSPEKTDKKNVKMTVIEKSRTLPSSFESDDSSSDAPSASSVGAVSKAKAFSSKAAKQLLMITKHFGSLGRMSKRIKKNLGTFAKRGTSFRHKRKTCDKSDPNQIRPNDSSEMKNDNFESEPSCVCDVANDAIIAALLHTDRRHIYYDEMIRNYLNTARARFLRQVREKKSSASTNSNVSNSSASSKSSSTGDTSSVTPCVNTGCKMFGTSQNNYLCSTCFAEQKQQFNDCRIPTKANSSADSLQKTGENNKSVSDSHSDDLKVPLNSPKSKLVDEDLVISCANSNFYVPTSI